MYKKLSNGISWVLHPFLLPLYLIVVLLTLTVFAHYPANVKFYLLWVVVLYAMIIPLLALGVLRSSVLCMASGRPDRTGGVNALLPVSDGRADEKR